jgi:methylmalonyl-CoA mutase
LTVDNHLGIAQYISAAENYFDEHKKAFAVINQKAVAQSKAPVLGITGTGGAGKVLDGG